MEKLQVRVAGPHFRAAGCKIYSEGNFGTLRFLA
jgi:hypothetical protein